MPRLEYREAHSYDSLGGKDKLDWTLKETGFYTFVIEDAGLTDIGNYQLYFDIIKVRDVYPNRNSSVI